MYPDYDTYDPHRLRKMSHPACGRDGRTTEFTTTPLFSCIERQIKMQVFRSVLPVSVSVMLCYRSCSSFSKRVTAGWCTRRKADICVRIYFDLARNPCYSTIYPPACSLSLITIHAGHSVLPFFFGVPYTNCYLPVAY